jgi:hypothetical protein
MRWNGLQCGGAYFSFCSLTTAYCIFIIPNVIFCEEGREEGIKKMGEKGRKGLWREEKKGNVKRMEKMRGGKRVRRGVGGENAGKGI